MQKELVIWYRPPLLGGVNNTMGAFLERFLELSMQLVIQSLKGYQTLLTRGIISPGSVVSLWASSSLNEIR